MQISHEVLGLYLHLARASEQRRRWLVRDKMLVLAGATAAEMGLSTIAAYCRQKVLQHNPAHLVGHHETLETALTDDDFRVYLNRLRNRYSRERSEHMLDTLGISQANERESYYTDYEYAAALLGNTPAELDRQFSRNSAEGLTDAILDVTQTELPAASSSGDETTPTDSPNYARDNSPINGLPVVRPPRRLTMVWALMAAVVLLIFAVVWYAVLS